MNIKTFSNNYDDHCYVSMGELCLKSFRISGGVREDLNEINDYVFHFDEDKLISLPHTCNVNRWVHVVYKKTF